MPSCESRRSQLEGPGSLPPMCSLTGIRLAAPGEFAQLRAVRSYRTLTIRCVQVRGPRARFTENSRADVHALEVRRTPRFMRTAPRGDIFGAAVRSTDNAEQLRLTRGALDRSALESRRHARASSLQSRLPSSPRLQEEVVSAPRSRWQNPFVEKVIGSLRRDLLDNVIVGEATPADCSAVQRVLQLDDDAPLPREGRARWPRSLRP
jgi:hypothetical protein